MAATAATWSPPVRARASGPTRSFLALLIAASTRSGVTETPSRSSCVHHLLDGAEAVGLVVDREAPVEPDQRGVASASSRAQRAWNVPTQTPESGASAATRARISPAALLVNVRARMFLPGDPLPHQVGDPPGDHPRLARARAGQDEQGAVDVGDGLALGGGQVGEEVHGGVPSLVGSKEVGASASSGSGGVPASRRHGPRRRSRHRGLAGDPRRRIDWDSRTALTRRRVRRGTWQPHTRDARPWTSWGSAPTSSSARGSAR